MKYVCIAAVVACFGGSAVAAPKITTQSIDGKVYFMGPNCVTYQVVDANSINCMNKKGHFTYTVNGLTAEQAQPTINDMMAERAAEHAQHVQDFQNFMTALGGLGDSARSWGQQMNQQAQQYSAPQVQSMTPWGRGAVSYTVVGGAIIGSNGVSYRQVGNTVIGSDGTTCQMVGSSIVCR